MDACPGHGERQERQELLRRIQRHRRVEDFEGRIRRADGEIRISGGRELVIYWRQLAPKQKIEFNLDLECRVPGDYRGPASRAYLYYNADHKHWIEPIQVMVAPK